MALKTKEPVTTGLKLKVRNTENSKKKVMIYGNDGTGKSTFAEEYCKNNGLNPIVIDVDDTNFTNLPIVEVDLSTDLKAYKFVKNIVNEVVQSGEFDTIILDGVTSYLEMLVSKANGLKKYSDRAERFQDVLRTLLSSGMHLIFIGQSDMKVIYNEEHQSNKMVIKINSLVNEKYHCYVDDKGRYKVETEKYRVVEDSEKE
jgi:adenosyl cobinamide kinase/adenosyl cobinamide phosphate guanylyltransferase